MRSHLTVHADSVVTKNTDAIGIITLRAGVLQSNDVDGLAVWWNKVVCDATVRCGVSNTYFPLETAREKFFCTLVPMLQNIITLYIAICNTGEKQNKSL